MTWCGLSRHEPLLQHIIGAKTRGLSGTRQQQVVGTLINPGSSGHSRAGSYNWLQPVVSVGLPPLLNYNHRLQPAPSRTSAARCCLRSCPARPGAVEHMVSQPLSCTSSASPGQAGGKREEALTASDPLPTSPSPTVAQLQNHQDFHHVSCGAEVHQTALASAT